jgi:hypothetical protein
MAAATSGAGVVPGGTASPAGTANSGETNDGTFNEFIKEVRLTVVVN